MIDSKRTTEISMVPEHHATACGDRLRREVGPGVPCMCPDWRIPYVHVCGCVSWGESGAATTHRFEIRCRTSERERIESNDQANVAAGISTAIRTLREAGLEEAANLVWNRRGQRAWDRFEELQQKYHRHGAVLADCTC